MANFPHIEYIDTYNKEVRSVYDDGDYITFYKEEEYFEELEVYNKFIKECEKVVRKSQHYRIFENWVFNILGVNYCQVQPGITSQDATIEMHHGPLFTLYDYCQIVLEKYLKLHIPITTISIAREVLRLHFEGCVQVVMVSKTNHEAIHNRDLFINVKQGIGNLNKFIADYVAYFTEDQRYRIWNYMKICKEVKSFDTGILNIDYVKPLLFSMDDNCESNLDGLLG